MRENNARLLASSRAWHRSGARARYRCVLAFVRSADDPAPLLAHGTWEGRIADGAAPVAGGFGYDPCSSPRATQTVAELEPALKQALSHRARAAHASDRAAAIHRGAGGLAWTPQLTTGRRMR